MVKNTAQKAFPILFFMLAVTTISVQSCPTCLGRVTKTSPAYFKNIIYKDPSAKTNRSHVKSARELLNTMQAFSTKASDQKI